MQTVDEYLQYLRGKGFQFQEDVVGFIYFGKHYTNASDEIINTAIELTLKAQKKFDGSFYVSLLETFVKNQIHTRRDAIRFVKDHELLAI
ncbi:MULTISPECIES: DUF6123 family protein [Neobacillus]|jgi:hypothetical protein|uniref:DUF6123 family protein n=1 Tax=Neobacillus sedimentimangrovi TaxID=2699460 RepID=A0ABS8QLE7_9BACI|nr:DUF6123 family protein [Neobacillus sedimentimangrovi]AIM15378.1 hypothetical protein HW35_02980 [Bacillus sp. X1(2014)]MCD4839099.1 DUF6123 family protein [Neobacillus sedimentimangrovi]